MTRTYNISMLLTLTAAAGLAIAQPAKTQSDEKNLLRGPAVTESGSATAEISEKERQEQMREMFEENPIDMREYVVVLRAQGNLRSGNNRLNITPEQDEQLKAIIERFRADMRAFQQANMVRIRELRDAMNKEVAEQREHQRKLAQKEAQKESGESDNAMQEKGKDRVQAQQPGQGPAARKLRQFIYGSPATKTAVKSVQQVLSEEQHAEIQQHIFNTRQRALQRQSARPNRGNNAQRTPVRRGMDPERVREQRRNQDAQRTKEDMSKERSDD